MSSLPAPPALDSSPPTIPLTLKSQPRLRSRPIPHLSNPFDDPLDSPNLISHSPLNLTIHELLLLPSSPNPRTKLRHIAGESHDLPPLEATPRRRSKSKAPPAPISPRNGRRARRRLDKENVREDRVLTQVEDDAAKLKKRRQSRPRLPRKETLSLIPCLPSS